MNKKDIIKQIKIKKSFLCIGLDTDLERIPKHLLQYEDPIFEFNKQIIDSTKDFCVAFKINTAFYESYGSNDTILFYSYPYYHNIYFLSDINFLHADIISNNSNNLLQENNNILTIISHDLEDNISENKQKIR